MYVDGALSRRDGRVSSSIVVILEAGRLAADHLRWVDLGGLRRPILHEDVATQDCAGEVGLRGKLNRVLDVDALRDLHRADTCVLEVGVPQIGIIEPRPGEVRVFGLRAAEVGTGQPGIKEESVGEVGVIEVHTAEFSLEQVRPREVAPSHACAVQCRTAHVGTTQVVELKVEPIQVGPLQIDSSASSEPFLPCVELRVAAQHHLDMFRIRHFWPPFSFTCSRMTRAHVPRMDLTSSQNPQYAQSLLSQHL